MNAVTKTSINSDLPEFILHSLLLAQFGRELLPVLTTEGRLFGKPYYLAQAGDLKLLGFGRDATKRISLLKAVAEFYERRIMIEAYGKELSHIPRWQQSSNGFAVHFNLDRAISSARREAIERHLLQYTYFKDGWSGFYQVGRETPADGVHIRRLVSKYVMISDGQLYRAGIVVAQGDGFAGASFGYVCLPEEKLHDLDCWLHGIHEAVDKVKPMLNPKAKDDGTAVMRGIREWFTESFVLPTLGVPATQLLQSPPMEVFTFDLSTRWDWDFPFHAAFVRSDKMIPLIIPQALNADQQNQALEYLTSQDLRPSTLRSPVL